jgi:NADH-quinone oxidoreductase subunit J
VKAQSAALDSGDNLNLLARSLFSDYVFAFEITSVLLVIAVVGAVILARKPPKRLKSAVTDSARGDS